MHWRYIFRLEIETALRSLLTRESTDIITLDYLSVIAPKEQWKSKFQIVITIRRVNTQRIKWIYSQFTGVIPAVDQETFARPNTFEEGLNNEIDRQIKRIEKLQMIYQKLDNSELETLLYQIIQDEYRALNHLKDIAANIN